jgi:hypothetical protein
MPVLGYVDVVTGVSKGKALSVLRTFPLDVEIDTAAPRKGPLELYAMNPIDLGGAAGPELYVAAMVTRLDDTGQTVELSIAPGPGLVDIEVTVRLNASIFTTDVAAPSPKRGERFIHFGVRSTTEPLVHVGAVVGSTHVAGAVPPRDRTEVSIVSRFDRPRTVVVGQVRRNTVKANHTSGTMDAYRRATDVDLAGQLLTLRPSDPPTGAERWIHVDLTSPATGDGPPRAAAVTDVVDGTTGAVPRTGPRPRLRKYQVTWVIDGNETSPSPPTPAVGTTSGKLRVALPVWAAPVPPEPSLGGGTAPVPATERRVYRTVTSADGDSGEYFLVHQETNDTATEWIDTVGDDPLTEPMQTDMEIRVRHTTAALDAAREAPPAGGFASLIGSLASTGYEEDPAGAPRTRGTTYELDLQDTPDDISVRIDMRAAFDQPRIAWTSTRLGAPRGVGRAKVAIVPTGVDAATSSIIRAVLAGVPPSFGARWLIRGDSRVSVVVASATDLGLPVEPPIGLVAFRSSLDGAEPRVSPRSVEAVLTPEATAGTGRGVRRLELLVGLPWPTGVVRHAMLDDGIGVDLMLAPPVRFRGIRPPDRSLRVLSRQTVDGELSVVELTAGELPDRVKLDFRGPGGGADPSGATEPGLNLVGQVRRVRLRTHADAEHHPSGWNATRDRITVAVPDLGRQLDVELSQTVKEPRPGTGETAVTNWEAVLHAAIPLRVSATARVRPAPPPPGKKAVPAVTGLVADIEVPPTASVKATIGKDADGRDALRSLTGVMGGGSLSGRAGAEWSGTGFISARATPQVRAGTAWPLPQTVGDSLAMSKLASATVRLVGLQRLEVAIKGEEVKAKVAWDPDRPTRAFRLGVLEDHQLFVDLQRYLAEDPKWQRGVQRFGTRTGRSLAGVRFSHVPLTLSATVDSGRGHYAYAASEAIGRGQFWMEPTAWGKPDVNRIPRGVGLVEGTFVVLPRALDVKLVQPGGIASKTGPDNRRLAVKYERGGLELATCDRLELNGVRQLGWDRHGDLLGMPMAKWTRTDITFLVIEQQAPRPPAEPPSLDTMWLWQYQDRLGLDPDQGVAWDIARNPGLRVDLDLDGLDKHYSIFDIPPPIHWSQLGGTWTPKSELQMKGYAGAETMDSPAGSDNPLHGLGPTFGLWFLRSFGKILGSSSAYFGNTGGAINSRPRIYS